MRKSGFIWDFMPRIIVGLGLVVWNVGPLYGTTSFEPGDGIIGGGTLCFDIPDKYQEYGCMDNADPSCTSLCGPCNPTQTRASGGYLKIITYKTTVTGIVPTTNGCNFICEKCKSTTTVSCLSGYYGTANSDGTSGCTACPDNATCKGGNGSTFVCNEGYLKSASSCVKCGTNQTLNEDGTACVCKKDYYLYNSTCLRCPDHTKLCTSKGDVHCDTGYYRSEISRNGYKCVECPTITDSDTGYAVYTNEALNTAARGTSSALTTKKEDCYWGEGIYYDKTGMVSIDGDASADTCPYSAD